MDSLAFLEDRAWDFPFFKKLAANDTGSAPGHQGGMVIPRSLRKFFPSLIGQPTSASPTVDRDIDTILVVDGQVVAKVTTRYQIQTWGATRRAESRLTRSLGPLRNMASSGDFLVMQRSFESLDLYRLWLITSRSASFNMFTQLVDDRRWGTVRSDVPMAQDDIDSSTSEIEQSASEPFRLFEEEMSYRVTTAKKAARSFVFRATIQRIYDKTCAVCRGGLRSPIGRFEVTAAHVVPKSKQGTDDPRNGLALCRTHHWAFDNGLFGIDNNRCVIVPSAVANLQENAPLVHLQRREIREAEISELRVDPDALDWHMRNVFLT